MTHLIGIGGVGMSALAEALVSLGHAVSGSDRLVGTVDRGLWPPSLARLEALGVKVHPDDGSGIDGSVGRIIVSTAIEEGNPGLARAKSSAFPSSTVRQRFRMRLPGSDSWRLRGPAANPPSPRCWRTS